LTGKLPLLHGDNLPVTLGTHNEAFKYVLFGVAGEKCAGIPCLGLFALRRTIIGARVSRLLYPLSVNPEPDCWKLFSALEIDFLFCEQENNFVKALIPGWGSGVKQKRN
jgi:hypothetical protein